jgi:hypothetical protein
MSEQLGKKKEKKKKKKESRLRSQKKRKKEEKKKSVHRFHRICSFVSRTNSNEDKGRPAWT